MNIKQMMYTKKPGVFGIIIKPNPVLVMEYVAYNIACWILISALRMKIVMFTTIKHMNEIKTIVALRRVISMRALRGISISSSYANGDDPL
jgi:hypothetical protein